MYRCTLRFSCLLSENTLVAYRLFCAMWIYVGLAWVSMILTDVSDYIQKTDNKISDKIDRLSQKKVSSQGYNIIIRACHLIHCLHFPVFSLR